MGGEGLGKRLSVEEIIVILRQVDDLLSQRWSVRDAVSALGLTQATYYQWKALYDGMNNCQVLRDEIESGQLKRLKELEAENAMLRKAVSDMLQEKTMLSKVLRTDP